MWAWYYNIKYGIDQDWLTHRHIILFPLQFRDGILVFVGIKKISKKAKTKPSVAHISARVSSIVHKTSRSPKGIIQKKAVPPLRTAAPKLKRPAKKSLRSIPRSFRKTGRTFSPLHPYMRAMFIALAIGSIGVFGSMFYYIKVAQATAPILDVAASTISEGLMQGTFAHAVRDLESQRAGMDLVPPREYLRKQAEAAGADYNLLRTIAYCESKWQMKQNTKSTAYGYFQIIDGTEKLTPQFAAGLRKTDPYVNIDMAIFLYQKYGTIPWTESQDCWKSE